MGTRAEIENSLKTIHADRSFFGHPRGLATLFFIEMWERFSYYGMRALLILFMTAAAETGGLGFGVRKSGSYIWSLHGHGVPAFCLAGGWMADRITGQRRAVLYGGVLIAAGQFCLVAPSETVFYFGLVLLMLGTGLLKPNASTIVGQIYAPGDQRRDAGFSIFYMGINLGALIAPLYLWMGRRKDQLAAGIRTGGRGNAHRRDSIHARRQTFGIGRECIPSFRRMPQQRTRQKRNA